MKRYDSYKPSGISWIAEIPSHWNELKAKYLFTRQNRPVREIDEVVTCFRDGQVTLRKNRRTSGFTESLQECGYQGIRKGDLVIHQMDAFAGSTGISDSDGKSTPVYIVCTPSQEFIYNPYYGYVIRNMGLNGYIQSLYRGIRERSSNFNFDVFSQQYLPIPPKEEQKRIVEFLSAKSTLIETQKKEREREIQLLNELKQAEIANVVLHGLNPDAAMKDSGILWVGNMPAHWKIRRNKYLFEEQDEKNSNLSYELLTFSRKKGIIPFSEANEKEPSASDLSNYKVIHPGQLLENRMQAWSGMFAKSEIEGCVSPDYSVFAATYDDICVDYFAYLFRTNQYIAHWANLSHGVGDGFNRLYTNQFHSVYALVPPFEEQKAIVEFIKSRSLIYDDMIANLRAEIDTLTEYKQRLIADVVTGQVDVRNL